jgi:hypothetical protein
MLKILLQIFGVALILSGGLWTLQGLGLVMWPKQSFMLDQRIWAVYGIAAMTIGALLLKRSKR